MLLTATINSDQTTSPRSPPWGKARERILSTEFILETKDPEKIPDLTEEASALLYFLL
jgi:hypothetical protein